MKLLFEYECLLVCRLVDLLICLLVGRMFFYHCPLYTSNVPFGALASVHLVPLFFREAGVAVKRALEQINQNMSLQIDPPSRDMDTEG